MMQTDVIYGYGLDHTVLTKVKPEAIEKYIQTHDSEMYAGIKDNADGEESFTTAAEYYAQDCDYSDPSVWALVAIILSKETGLDFEYHEESDCGREQALMLVERLPWYHSERERNITQNEVDTILADFAHEIGISETVIPDSVRVEYFG